MVSSDEDRSDSGGMGDGTGIDSVGVKSDDSSRSDGVGKDEPLEGGEDGVISSDGSVGEVGVRVDGDGTGVATCSVGVISETSLGSLGV